MCQNDYLLVTDGNLTCQERGTWSGEVQCQREELTHMIYHKEGQLWETFTRFDVFHLCDSAKFAIFTSQNGLP